MTARPMARRVAPPRYCICPAERVYATERGVCLRCHERVAPTVTRTLWQACQALVCGAVVAFLMLALMWAFGWAAVVAR